MKILATTGMGLFLLGLAACIDGGFDLDFGSDLCSSNPCGIIGTYALQSIDGQALPVVVSELTDPILVEVTAGSVTINEDLSPSPQPAHGTCSVSSTTRETMTDGTTTMETETKLCTHTFDFNTQALTLTLSPDSTVKGSITSSDATGTTLTLYADGSVFVYGVSVGLLPST